MNNVKGQVIRRVLDSTSRFIALDVARFMTLGGKGDEARIWEEKGIKHVNGWLLERSVNGLIRGFRFRQHNQLRTFPQILAGYGADQVFVDSAHIDLCGTLNNRAIADFAPVLPLVFNSKGRCLAITIADARRNPILDDWPRFKKRGRKLFGTMTDQIYEKIFALQRMIPTNESLPDFIKKLSFTPEKGAKREFGFLVELCELLGSHGFKWLPSTIERYVYVSKYSGSAFRMRTYFFRFDVKKVLRPELAFARMWTKSPLFYSRGETFTEVSLGGTQNQPKEKDMPKHKTENIPGTLACVAEAIGGDIEAEYKKLVEQARNASLNADKAKRFDEFTKAYEAISGVGSIGDLASLSPVPALPAALSVRKAKSGRFTWDSFTPQEQVKWLLDVLETRMKTSKKMWDPVWEKFLRDQFGYYDKRLGYKMRSVLATSCGKFRPGFERRIKEAFNGDAGSYLDRLAKLPSKVPDKLA